MLILKNKMFIWVLAALIFSACTSESKEVPVITVRFDNSNFEYLDSVLKYPQDNIKRDIPEFYAHMITHLERQKVETALKIRSLENGIAGEQIRIQGNEYDEYNDGSWERLIVFTKNDDWKADVYYIRYAAEDDLIRIIDSLQYQQHSLAAPKSGWSVFMDSLKYYGLYTLPDYTAIPEYNHEATHETVYTVEMANKQNYRIYSYLDPIRREQRFPEAKKFVSILELIKRQFSLPEPQTPKKKL